MAEIPDGGRSIILGFRGTMVNIIPLLFQVLEIPRHNIAYPDKDVNWMNS